MVGDNIKRIMKRKMWTQAKLAEAIGWSENAVQQWVNNKTIPNAYAMLDIAEAMGISILELYGDTNDRKKHQKNHG